jgi:hypothetical protein
MARVGKKDQEKKPRKKRVSKRPLTDTKEVGIMADVDVAEIARQIGQQVAEQVGQSVSQAITKLLQTQAQTTGGSGVFTREEMGDIGGTERLEKDQMFESGLLFANAKRTYDEYQHESLESIKRNRSYVDKVLSDAATHDNRVRVMAEQALQNAVETANMVSKQAVRHSDIAIDRQWNVNETDYAAEQILKSLDPTTAITVLSKILADMAAEKTKK